MTRIFINYRRQDSQHQADRLYRELRRYLPDEKDLFIDIDDIPYGVNFVTYIDDTVGKCDVVLVLVGQQWLNARSTPDGPRRLDDPHDFVRLEIASALGNDKIAVVPIILDDAFMPEAKDLPENLRALVTRNGDSIKRLTFEADVARIAGKLGLRRQPDTSLQSAPQDQPRSQSAPAAQALPVAFDHRKYVFISYPNDINPAAMRAIVRQLIADGLPVWLYDPAPFQFLREELRSIRWQLAGLSWEEQTINALMGAKCVLALVSKSSGTARYQPREIDLALRHKPLVAIIVDDTHPEQLPEKLRARHVMRTITAGVTEESWADANAKQLHMLSFEVRERIADGQLLTRVVRRKGFKLWVAALVGSLVGVATIVVWEIMRRMPVS